MDRWIAAESVPVVNIYRYISADLGAATDGCVFP